MWRVSLFRRWEHNIQLMVDSKAILTSLPLIATRPPIHARSPFLLLRSRWCSLQMTSSRKQVRQVFLRTPRPLRPKRPTQPALIVVYSPHRMGIQDLTDRNWGVRVREVSVERLSAVVSCLQLFLCSSLL